MSSTPQLSKEQIEKIFAENDPFEALSKPELEILRKDLQKQKDKLGSKIADLSRKWKTSEKEKDEAGKEYVLLSNRIRAVDAKIKTFIA